ncbi:hypothetical protein HG531_013974 [Fusarium graminearum]|nr:hypothetical protein HG531_013974 [Fusarium graminearum]
MGVLSLIAGVDVGLQPFILEEQGGVLHRNAVCQQLELIIDTRAVARVTGLDEMLHEVGGIALTLVQNETLAEVLDTFRFEAGQAAVHHERDDLAELLAVLTTSEEGLDTELLESLEALTVDGLTTEHISGDRVGQYVNDTAAGGSGSDSVGEDVDIEADIMEDASECSNHLQCQHILSTIIANLENGRLPDLDRLLRSSVIPSVFLVHHLVHLRHAALVLLDAECRHVRRFCVTLQRLSGLAINSNDNAIGVTRKIDADLDLDLA